MTWCVCVRECGPEAPDVTPTRVPKECGYGNFTFEEMNIPEICGPQSGKSGQWPAKHNHRPCVAKCNGGQVIIESDWTARHVKDSAQRQLLRTINRQARQPPTIVQYCFCAFVS